VSNIDRRGFNLKLSTEEALASSVLTEEIVGYLAILKPPESWSLVFGTREIPYYLSRLKMGHSRVPLLGVEGYLEEEKSGDPEISHILEAVDLLVLGHATFGQITSNNEEDTVALRRIIRHQ